MNEDQRDKLRVVLRRSYWEYLAMLRRRKETLRLSLDDLALDLLGDFLTYWVERKDAFPRDFESIEAAYAWIDALIEDFEKDYCVVRCGGNAA